MFNFTYFLNLRLIALLYGAGFFHASSRISHRHTYAPSLMNLLPTSPPSHPSRLSLSAGLSLLCYTAHSHWLSISHLVMYMFACYSLTSSHPLPSTLCPQVCLCLHCCSADRLISTIFLDSMYMH